MSEETFKKPTQDDNFISIGSILEIIERVNQKSLRTSPLDQLFQLPTRYDASSLQAYIDRLQSRLQIEEETLIIAFGWSRRLETEFNLQMNKRTSKRMMLACALIASKWHEDDQDSNKKWASIGGIGWRQLNALELHVCTLFSFEFFVTLEMYETWRSQIGLLREQMLIEHQRDNDPQKNVVQPIIQESSLIKTKHLLITEEEDVSMVDVDPD